MLNIHDLNAGINKLGPIHDNRDICAESECHAICSVCQARFVCIGRAGVNDVRIRHIDHDFELFLLTMRLPSNVEELNGLLEVRFHLGSRHVWIRDRSR